MQRVFGYSHQDVNTWRESGLRLLDVLDAARELHGAFLTVDHETRAVTMNRQWVRLDSALARWDAPRPPIGGDT
jgi:hypothetical protein